MINFVLENELKPDLNSEEKLIWTGKPKTGIVFRNSDIFLIPFSLFWFAFAIFWELSVITSNAPFFFIIWGIPFICVGLYITVGRFLIDAKRRANTIYGITSDRIIIKSGIFSRELKSLNIKTISDITLKQKADKSGNITLGPSDFRYSMMQGIEWPGIKQIPCLEFIDDVKMVYDKIIAIQNQK